MSYFDSAAGLLGAVSAGFFVSVELSLLVAVGLAVGVGGDFRA